MIEYRDVLADGPDLEDDNGDSQTSKQDRDDDEEEDPRVVFHRRVLAEGMFCPGAGEV